MTTRQEVGGKDKMIRIITDTQIIQEEAENLIKSFPPLTSDGNKSRGYLASFIIHLVRRLVERDREGRKRYQDEVGAQLASNKRSKLAD